MASGVASADDAPAQVQDKIPLLIVHSQPELDARIEASQLRLLDNCKHLPYFINITERSDWKKTFEKWTLPYKWPHMNNEAYSKRVIYHIAAQNNGDIGRMARDFFYEGRFGDPTTVNIAALNALTSEPKRIHDVFRPDEVALYSEQVLFKVFEWHFLTTKRMLEENFAALNAPNVALSKSMNNSPMLRPAKHRRSKSQLSIEVPAHVPQPHLIMPPSAGMPPPINPTYGADSRRTASAQVPIRQTPGMRGGDRAASGPVFDAPTGLKTGPAMGQRHHMPPAPNMSRPPHPLSQQSTPGQMMHPQPAAYHRRENPGGTVPTHGNMSQLPPPPSAMRMSSGEVRHMLPHPMSGHMYGPPMAPHPAQHAAMGPPPPSMGMGVPIHSPGLQMSPMQPMQPVYFDHGMVPPGARLVEPGGGGTLYDPNQHHPAQNRQELGRSAPRNSSSNYSGYVDNSRNNNNNNYRGRKQSRGRGGGGRGGGMPSYDGGRRQSFHVVDRPVASNMHMHEPMMPPPPHPAERSHRESFSHAKSQETERFPDFHQEQQEPFSIDNIPRELQCLRKFIGSDVEDMDSLWIGNIPHGTSDHTIQSLIEENVHVPVVMVKPVMTDASKTVGWTIVTFHKTSDARLVLEKFEQFRFRDHLLDVQVPERCRHDLPGYKVQSRRSSNKHSVVDGPMPGVPVGPRSSFSRNNSIRQFRTNSLAHSDGSGRRNSLFSPQDARSDIPVLPDLPEVAEALSAPPDSTTPTGRGEGSTTASSQLSTSAVMHATAASFVPPQYNSFGAEISGLTNKHLAIEERFHRSASSESLRRTSQGYDYEFSFDPSDEAGDEQAIEDDARDMAEMSHSVQNGKSRSCQDGNHEDAVVELHDDATVTQELKIEEEPAQILATKDVDVVQGSPVYSIKDGSVTSLEEPLVPATEVSEVIRESPAHGKKDEAVSAVEETPIPKIEQGEILQAVSEEEPTATSAEALPIPTSEADQESRAGSVLSEAPTETLSDTATDKASGTAARKSAVPSGSIHPFAKAKAKVTNTQRQVSKADKKKAKKQGQVSKKKPEPATSFTTEASEPEVLSLDEIKAKLKTKPEPSEAKSAAKSELPLTEVNVESLFAPAAESSTPVLDSSPPSHAAEEMVVVSGAAKVDEAAVINTITAARLPMAPKTLPKVALPREPALVKRTPSVTITTDLPRKERQSSTASAASESSFGTPRTAKEYQTPAPSPALDMSTSPPVAQYVLGAEQVVEATARPEFEAIADGQNEVNMAADAEAVGVDSLAPVTQANKKKKNQQRKRLNRQNNKKNSSVDGQDNGAASQPLAEAAPESMSAKLSKNLGCTGMDQESPPNADKATPTGFHDDNATPGIPSAVTGRDEKSSVSKTNSNKTSSHAAKENVAGPSRSWAQLLASSVNPATAANANVSTKGGLTLRDPNAGQQHAKGG
ncbi:hypothetical protein FKW77_000404 [Venturia effusa]|uniref:RRM domain-containing protein n=1 Tax=Venturia effusa TaxID=50376 RepID=A0A517L2L6_9PEZI|nr:hypothetical protein FKW77_000404 [Venturia effusa]